jgi:acetylornithine/succinyldiaminopimelate/putrescine aminotransferase/predicted amino acid dehydrogenase
MEHSDEPSLSLWLKSYVKKEFCYDWNQQNILISNLGFDSITTVALISQMERDFRISISTDILYKISDTDDLLREIKSIMHGSTVDLDNNEATNYADFVNPYIADKLEKLKIDKVFTKALGPYLYDSEGKEYLDFLSQYGAVPFGHHSKEIWQAVTELQDESEPIFSQPSLQSSAGKLAKELIRHAPDSLRYVTFTNSGAESVEAALKMSIHITGRSGVLSTKNSFHGKTLGALSVTGNLEYQAPFGMPFKGFDIIAYDNIPELKSILQDNPEKYACFIVEPIQGEGGVVVPDSNYLKEAHALCKKSGVVFIVDEIQTGMGRTGNIFYCNELGVEPDIILVSKALGGGVVPIGAVISSKDVYSEKFALKHSSTFAGNALATRVGLATINFLTKNDGQIIKNIRKEGKFIKEELEKLKIKFPLLLKDVRGCGLMLGLRFTSDRNIFPENFLGIAAEQKELTQLVASYLLNVKSIRVAPTLNKGDVLRIQPPYNVTHEQCVTFINAMWDLMSIISQGDTGIFYRSILDKKSYEKLLPVSDCENNVFISKEMPQNGIRFAFIVHPLDEKSYADYDKTLKSLSENELKEFSKSMSGIIEPVIGSQMTLKSNTGAVVHGDFIMVSHTAKQLQEMPIKEALTELKKAINLACQRGAKIVGLGAYTSIISGGGELLRNIKVALTTGNSFTVHAGVEALELALNAKNLKWDKVQACVVGAAGAIGSCMSIMLARKAKNLILVGNPMNEFEVGRGKLLKVAEGIIKHTLESNNSDALDGSLCRRIFHISADVFEVSDIISILEAEGSLILTSSITSVGMANVVITSTSSPESFIDYRAFKSNAIVLDISRPRTISKDVVLKRDDITVLDGGVISLPGKVYVGPYGIEKGTSYACMAETILLALEERFEDISIGRTLNIEEVLEQGRLAKKHGLAVAGLQTYGKKANIN